jgi:N-acetyl sugar amidotransferase
MHPSRPYQMCTKLVMDTSDPDIVFDEDGVCNYWHEYQEVISRMPRGQEKARLLEQTVEQIRDQGVGAEYDCILGLSGGVDSSFLAHLSCDLGLRPLVVHFDNGWNNELAVSNIEKIVRKLNLDLHTFVMDWVEFKDIQRSYFKASVLDLEVPTDHMIFGALFKLANEKGIQYILSGNNVVTEWLLPKAWYYSKFDLSNLKAIHKCFGTGSLKKLPALGVWHMAYYQLVRNIQDVKLLDLVEYRKKDAKQLLQDNYGWRDYGGKHFESIFTRFYQGYILPTKFGIDKRKAHLSNLICSGEMEREEALEELRHPPYSEDLQKQDKQYVARKLGFSKEEFDNLLGLPSVSHKDYGTDRAQRIYYFRVMEALKPFTRIMKRYRGS